ncbi:hypothetical protein PMAYCL1PPCAC_12372 [Pristionchus mayeri]|uniref:Uncharacterized protein n=1 Tax=Pristionchus mayeri TaxID=1317129 RepID=A0AAN4ZPS4_9BILA|nr:hypothetical protein PMAYCL1PPCAC_12372 [Pristionchus mayeri]
MDDVSTSSQSTSILTSSIDRVSTPYEESRRSKKKFIPWEPHKAACGEKKHANEPPTDLPRLFPYQQTSLPHREFVYDGIPLVDARRERLKKSQTEVEETLREEIERLEMRLKEEQKKGEELRRVLAATMDSDVAEYVVSMSEDKTRLAAMIEEYSKKIAIDSDTVESLSIERDIWRSKYVAMAVRSHEEGMRAENALNLALSSQRLLAEVSRENCRRDSRIGNKKVVMNIEVSPLLPPPLSTRASEMSLRPLSHLFARSPCEEKVCRRDPIYSNLTITCCTKCAGREIYLL